MPLIVPDSFAIQLLNTVLNTSTNARSIGQAKVVLYKNDYTPTRSSTLGDFEEATFPGAGSGAVDLGGWTPAALVSGTPQATYDNSPGFTFTCTSGGGQLIYGYFVLNNDADPDALLFAERFDTPRLVAPGVPLVLLLNFTLKSQYPES